MYNTIGKCRNRLQDLVALLSPASRVLKQRTTRVAVIDALSQMAIVLLGVAGLFILALYLTLYINVLQIPASKLHF